MVLIVEKTRLCAPPFVEKTKYEPSFRCESSRANLKKELENFSKTYEPIISDNSAESYVDLSYAKVIEWSPDGLCILTSSSDKVIRLYETPATFYSDNFYNNAEEEELLLKSVFEIKEPESILDIKWNPLMKSKDASSCYFVSVVIDHPIRIYNAYTGERLGCININLNADQIETPNTLSFSPDATKVYCGLKNRIEVVDLYTMNCTAQYLTPGKKSKDGVKGIVSKIKFNPFNSNSYAISTFSGNLGVYDIRQEHQGGGNDKFKNVLNAVLEPFNSKSVLKSPKSSILDIKYSPCGVYILVLNKKSNKVVILDLRNFSQIYSQLSIPSNSYITSLEVSAYNTYNKYHVFLGDNRGILHLEDIGLELTEDNTAVSILPNTINNQTKLHESSINNLKLHPLLPILISSSGFPRSFTVSKDGTFSKFPAVPHNCSYSDSYSSSDNSSNDEMVHEKLAVINNITKIHSIQNPTL